MSNTQVKGFRQAKQPNKREVMTLNDQLQKQMVQTQSAITFVMQHLSRLANEYQQLSREMEALSSLVATRQLDDNDTLQEQDIAIINFVGVLKEDGLPFDGGASKRTAIRIGSKNFIPGFEEALVGLKVGEQKEIALTFPAEYGAKQLAGKEVVFTVLVIDGLRDRVSSQGFDKLVEGLNAKKQEKLANEKKSEETTTEEQKA